MSTASTPAANPPANAVVARLYCLGVRLLPLAFTLLSACSYGYGEPSSRPLPPERFAARPAVAPANPAQVALGRALFNDPGLSGDGLMSCASCHRPDRGFGDGEVKSPGAGGRPLARHTPGLWNVAFAASLFGDGRAATLEEQALAPIHNPAEMARPPGTLVATLVQRPAMRAAFARAFPASPVVSEANVAKALANYERTLVSGAAPFDRWAAGEAAALSPAAVRGYSLFAGPAGCSRCHQGWSFSDGRFHDIGLGDGDVGRAAITGRPSDRFAFRTPSLREVGRTAPYMHDGSLPTLAAVVDHYADGAVRRRGAVPRVALTPAQRADLVAFLSSLDSPAAAPAVTFAAATPSSFP